MLWYLKGILYLDSLLPLPFLFCPVLVERKSMQSVRFGSFVRYVVAWWCVLFRLSNFQMLDFLFLLLLNIDSMCS